jgi:hypothetical protein
MGSDEQGEKPKKGKNAIAIQITGGARSPSEQVKKNRLRERLRK